MKNQHLISRTIVVNCLIILALFSGFTNNKSNPESDAKEKNSSNKPQMKKKQLRHVVLFKFKESATAEDIAKVEKAFTSLPDKIPQIKVPDGFVSENVNLVVKGICDKCSGL